jgi:crotonobetainyl-CoA:carnitine CoA-transferase CaiB-like acyl-CoA transferase
MNGERKISRQPNFLHGISVLDLSGPLAAFSSKLLADLGAKVTRVEWGSSGIAGGCDPFSYRYYNGNKRIITLNHDDQNDQTELNDLIQESDILINSPIEESFFPDIRRVIAANPRLIHIFITPFGTSGPKSSYVSSNAVISAYGGHTYVTGSPDGPPLTPFGNQSYYGSSLFGAVAALAALRQRELTGCGQFVDLSAEEALVSTLDHVMVDYFASGTITRRQGSVYGDHAFVILPCKDGYVQITILQNWDTLLELMAADDRAADLMDICWQSDGYRFGNFDYILKVVQRWTSLHTRNELFDLGQAMRFPWASVCTIDDVLESPHLAAREFLVPRNNAACLLPDPPYQFIVSEPTHDKKLLSHENAPGTGILKGIKVLDFTWMLAGPYATRILADLGAEVIKVQSYKTAKGAEDNETMYFATWNRNKRSITCDMDSPGARQTILTLAAQCDIVVENFAPRIMTEWGLTYGALCQANPDIIMASISAMGQTGPWRDYVGFAPTFHTLSGLIAQTSIGLPFPICLGHAYGDTIIGLYAALAILSALRHRDATGCGAYIDLSGYEALCTLMGPAIAEASSVPESIPNLYLPTGTYPCQGQDRWCVIDPSCEAHWQALLSVNGLEDLKHELFSTPAGRKENYKSMEDIIAQWTINHTPESIVHMLQELKIPSGVVQNAQDIADDTQLKERHFFINLLHPRLGHLISDRTALLYGKDEPKSWKPAPLLGADNALIRGL